VETTTLDLLHISVNGSMQNPYAAGAVAVWTSILCVAAVWMVRSITSRQAISRVCLFAGLALLTRPAQVLIGSLLYWIGDRAVTGVSFLGGPPVWIGPTVSSIVALATWVCIRAIRRVISTS
jgi:Na+/citrate or Na+/malate symporter